MPRRPRAHIIEDIARARLRETFGSVGWVIEDLSQDYGEDIFVRVFEEGQATPWSFFMQSKATDNIQRYLVEDKAELSFPIKTRHLEHWRHFWEPVVLTIWDSSSDITCWEFIQDFLDSLSETQLVRAKEKATLRVRVPTFNRLDRKGIDQILSRTKSRFERFEVERTGAVTLIRAIKEIWGVKIHYNPQFGILTLPHGRFVQDPSGNRSIFTFGRFEAFLDVIGQHTGWDQERLIKEFMIQGVIHRLLEEEGPLLPGGRMPKEFRNRSPLSRPLDALDEDSFSRVLNQFKELLRHTRKGQRSRKL